MSSILSRVNDILKSNIHAALDGCEDPEKMIDQLLRDARSNLAQVKKESAEVIAQESAALRTLQKERADITEVTKRVKAALSAGNEADALKLAERLAKEESEMAQAEKVYDMCKANADNMRSVFRKLTADVAGLDAKRANLKGLLAAAKAQETVNKTVSKTSGGTGAKIADFESKIQKKFDAAQAAASLDAEVGDETDSLMQKYTAAGNASDILAKIKGDMGMVDNEALAVPEAATAEDILIRFKNAEVVGDGN